MKTVVPETSQTMQRVKVGMIGLAAVVLLIGLASAIFSTASRERPVAAVGAPNAQIVANMAITNDAAAADTASEPLADIGVAPSTDVNAAQAAAHP